MIQEVSGKQVLSEFETLLKDTGMYLFSVGKRVYCFIKKAIKKHENADKREEQNCDIISADGNVIVAAKAAA